MSVPHLDTRVVDGESSLLFGPYAGFTPKFLKTRPGSTCRSHPLAQHRPMLAVAAHNFDLMKYLIGELLAEARR